MDWVRGLIMKVRGGLVGGVTKGEKWDNCNGIKIKYLKIYKKRKRSRQIKTVIYKLR